MTHFQMNAPSTLSKLYSTPLSNKLSLSNRRPPMRTDLVTVFDANLTSGETR